MIIDVKYVIICYIKIMIEKFPDKSHDIKTRLKG